MRNDIPEPRYGQDLVIGKRIQTRRNHPAATRPAGSKTDRHDRGNKGFAQDIARILSGT